MKKKFSKKDGFTLIELVIVIAIIALLASLAIPRYKMAKLSALVAGHNSNVQTLKSAAILYVTANPELDNISTEALIKYLDDEKLPEIPSEISGGKTWEVIKNSDGDITISPGLVKLDGDKIVAISADGNGD